MNAENDCVGEITLGLMRAADDGEKCYGVHLEIHILVASLPLDNCGRPCCHDEDLTSKCMFAADSFGPV